MNNEKSTPYEFSFDEKKLCYELFTLRNNKIRTVVKHKIIKETMGDIYDKVTKYLLHIENVNPIEVRQLLRKYTVLLSYIYLCSVENVNMEDICSKKVIKEIEYILENISVEVMKKPLTSKNFLSDLYNDIDYNDALMKLKSKLIKVNQDAYEKVNKLLRGEFNYFSKNTDLAIFEKYNEMRRFDMIVAENLLNTDFFSFNVDFDEDFIHNILNEKTKIPASKLRIAKTYVGHLIHYAFMNNDFRFEKKVEYLGYTLFQFCTAEKNASFNKIGVKFIIEKVVVLEEVEYFTFTYNGIKGEFTKSGIKYSMIG